MATKYIVSKIATCHECIFEYTGKFAEREANKHADKTGHIPTLEVCYDVLPQNKKSPRP